MASAIIDALLAVVLTCEIAQQPFSDKLRTAQPISKRLNSLFSKPRDAQARNRFPAMRPIQRKNFLGRPGRPHLHAMDSREIRWLDPSTLAQNS
jgi:hypothetical protein